MVRSTPVNGFIGCAAALADHNYAAAVATVTRPVLFMVGEKDGVTPPAMRKLSEALPGSRYVELPGAGHISNLDQPQAFTPAMPDFLKPPERAPGAGALTLIKRRRCKLAGTAIRRAKRSSPG